MTHVTAMTGASVHPHRRIPALALAVAFALIASACGAVTPTPSGSAATGSPAATGTALGSAGPGPTGPPGGGGSAAPAVLPLPTLSEPFAVGDALYDPTRMDVAVVSLLKLMGVGIYARNGTPIRKGAEHAAGDPWLFDTEVRGLIDMGIEDLLAADDEGATPFAFSDLYDSVALFLADPMSREDFLAAYADAYAEHPDDLVPQVLLGQPIEATTPLTRTQLWLLFMDGLIGPTAATAAYLPPGSRIAQAATGPAWGTAQRSLPPFSQPPGMSMTADDFRELIAHYPTLPETIHFWTLQSDVHEGHGGPGQTEEQSAIVDPVSRLVSPVTGHVLIEPSPGGPAGIEITWRSRDQGVLRAHGTLSATLPATVTTDADGSATIAYTPKKEEANGQGVIANDFASLYATVERANVSLLYHLPVYPPPEHTVAWWGGTVTANGVGFPVEWHTAGIEVTVKNEYNVDINLLGIAGARAQRNGVDTWHGVLTPRADGTWRGTFEGRIGGPGGIEGIGRIDRGTLLLPVVAGTCTVQYGGDQSLWVVGRPQSALFGPGTTERLKGAFGAKDLVLHFYPASPPAGNSGVCNGERYEPYVGVPYVGPGPDGAPMFGTYASFNDLRWNAPDPGFVIHLPDEGELEYELVEPGFIEGQVESTFTVTVNRTGP